MISPSNASDKSVTWKSSNSEIAKVDQEGLVTALAPGSVVFTVSTVDGSFSDEKEIIVFDPVASINDEYSLKILAYPNPTSSSIQLKGLPNGPCNIQIMSISGVVLGIDKVVSDGTYYLDLKDQAPGLYIVNLSWKSGSATVQVIRQE